MCIRDRSFTKQPKALCLVAHTVQNICVCENLANKYSGTLTRGWSNFRTPCLVGATLDKILKLLQLIGLKIVSEISLHKMHRRKFIPNLN